MTAARKAPAAAPAPPAQRAPKARATQAGRAATSKAITTWPVAISVAAQRAGISARMVRHYESLGLVKGVARTDSGYRQYTEADVHALHFIRRSRDLGFSMEEIAELLGLWHNRSRASSQVKRIAQQHVEDLSERIAQMQAMQRSLQTLVSCCQGNDRPECPILDDLAAAPESPPPRTVVTASRKQRNSKGVRDAAALEPNNLDEPPVTSMQVQRAKPAGLECASS